MPPKKPVKRKYKLTGKYSKKNKSKPVDEKPKKGGGHDYNPDCICGACTLKRNKLERDAKKNTPDAEIDSVNKTEDITKDNIDDSTDVANKNIPEEKKPDGVKVESPKVDFPKVDFPKVDLPDGFGVVKIEDSTWNVCKTKIEKLKEKYPATTEEQFTSLLVNDAIVFYVNSL